MNDGTSDNGMALEPGEPDEPISSDALRKALAQAPDRTALPDWRVRQAILNHAHDAISASEELLSASRQSTPWWRLGWWHGKVGMSGGMRWNAVLATVIVGVLVTLMWQREPVPGARLDERPLPPAPSPGPVAQDEALRKEEPGRAAPAEATKPSPASPVTPPAAPRAVEPVPVPVAPSRPPVVAVPAQPPASASSSASAPIPLAPAPEPPPAPAAPAASAQAQRQAPAAAPVPMPPAASGPGAADAAGSSAGRNLLAAPDAATRRPAAPEDKKRGARQESAEPAAAPAAPPLMPDFTSLSRWTEMRVANVNGDVRVVPRSEAGDLSLLMSSAAIMAVGAPSMRALPEWRVSLERKGQVLAVLEVARSQVRWTEGKLPPSTGTPPIESLDALRTALRQAMRAGPAPRPAAPMPPVRAPRDESAPASAPAAPTLVDPPLTPPPAKE